jgi:hypothetical protein
MEPWVDEFVAAAGPLAQVRGRRDAGGAYSVLDFVFERRSLRLACVVDTDEIAVEPRDDAGAELEDVSADEHFPALIGKRLEYAWWMSNHRGYLDAFQMRLLDLGDRSSATRQFEVAAAAIHVRTVVR